MNLDTNLISDKEFMDMIPEFTNSFIEQSSRYLRSFDEINSNTILISMLLSISLMEEYVNVFKKYGLHSDLSEYTKCDLSRSFLNENIKYFRIPNFECEKNIILTPLRLIQYYLEKDSAKPIEVLKLLGIEEYAALKIELDKMVELEEKCITNEKSINYLKGLSSTTISYLEMVGKIYSKLLEYDDMNVVGYSKNSLKAISYFLALFLFKDNNETINYNEAINEFFKSKGISLENILKILNIELKDLEKIDPTLILNSYFSAYEGTTKTTITSIFNSQFINTSERKVVIKKLLSACDIDFKIINELYSTLDDLNKNTNIKARIEYDKELNPDVIRFIENSYKIHKLIMPENGLPLVDGKIIQSVDDYVVIAILISSYYRDGLLGKFFKDNGITLENIYELIGLKLDFTKLNSVDINDKNIVINFYKFIDNVGKKYDSIAIEDYERTLTFSSVTKTTVLNRIFYDKTKINLPDPFIGRIDDYFIEKAKKEKEEIIERLFLNIDTDVYKYLMYVSCVYNNIKSHNFQKKNAQVISLLLATKYTDFYKDGVLNDYLESIGLKVETITSYLKINSLSYNAPENIFPKHLENDFQEFIFSGVNSNKKKEDITIESILENALNKELNDSYQISLLLEHLGLNYDSLKDLDNKSTDYIKQRDEKQASKNISELKSKCEDWYNCLYEACNVLNFLRQNSDKLNYKLSNDELKLLSILIAFLKIDSPYKKYFENQGITLLYVLNSINCPQDELLRSKIDEISDLQIYQEYKDSMSNLHNLFEIEYKKKKYDISYIARRLFNNYLYDSDIILKIIGDSNVANTIFNGLKEEKMVPLKVSVEQLLEQLEEQVKYKPEVDTSSVDSILEFILEGDSGLSKYSEYIQLQIKEINNALNLDESLDNIDGMVGDIYVDTPVKQKFFARIFTSKNDSKNIERTVNADVLSKLTEEIDIHIDTLATQVRKYRDIFKAISLYLGAIKNYYEVSVAIRDLLTEKRVKLENAEDSFSEILNIQQALEGINDKINGYERTTTLMKNQQFQIYQTIVNHLISRNALQTSKDDIIPIISSERLFSISSASGRSALELSNNLIGLFRNVIEQNVSGAKENLEMLKTSNLPQETVNKIIADFSTYIDEVDKNREEILRLSALPENVEDEGTKEEKVEQPKEKKLVKKNEG